MWNESPVQVRCMIQDAWGWCTGMTQRDSMGREVQDGEHVEKTLESPLDCKETQPVYPKGNQSWIFTRRTDAEAEALIFWPSVMKNWLIGKDPETEKEKIEGRRRRGLQRMRWLATYCTLCLLNDAYFSFTTAFFTFFFFFLSLTPKCNTENLPLFRGARRWGIISRG